jgi:hypothetical protein
MIEHCHWSADMRVVIRVAKKDRAKAWGLLVRHSPATALPDRIFIVSEVAARALKEAGIHFKEISREEGSPTSFGVVSGERI